ncbi:MAG: type IV secretion system DNA-binding domain-containing protein [Candidatus Peregrinibacteria bacterium]|nr:type IV secretion system DNA-binding domain-containing protein [Candidatus Peregrinibacteria bacterium]MCB9808216.1 type IV secretion system DNA-binding domain-containing protein [Candidatus Peribacteria bacterium]
MTHTILHIRSSKENERGPLYMEPALAGVHSLTGDSAQVNLEIGMAQSGKIGFYVRGTQRAARLTESQLYAQYPDIDIEYQDSDPFAVADNEGVVSVDLTLTDPEIFPIKRHPQFDDMLTRVNVDPIAGITSTLARYPEPGMRGHISIMITPLSGSFRRRSLRFIPLLSRGLSTVSASYAKFFTRVQLARGWRRVLYFPVALFLGGFRAWPGFAKFVPSFTVDTSFSSDPEEQGANASMRSHDRENPVEAATDKVNRLLFTCNIRVSVIAPKGKEDIAKEKLMEIASGFRQFALPQCNSFAAGAIRTLPAVDHAFRVQPFLLSSEELATLWHMPTILVQTPNLDWVVSKKLEPPNNLPLADREDDLTVLGAAVFRGQRHTFGVRPDDRRRHVYIIGKTGMGKSTLLENMVYSDIHSGKGLAVIDPHGDLIDAILRFVPSSRSNDVVLFNPSDTDYPISFNVLDCPNKDQRVLVASGLMSVFTKLWPDAFSGRMEHILRNTLLALLEAEGQSMMGIMRMFTDTAYREKIVEKVTDPMVKSFWNDEYASWSEKYRTEAIAAIQNKVGQLLSTPLIRNIVGQVKSTLDIRHAMDTGKIILVNLSKGKIGEDTSAFLGSMLVTKFQIDAMSRADIPESQRRDFYLYVDEFQNFATESFATILSEARKYRLNLTMANQYVAQLLIGDNNTKLRDAVFGNVGSLVSFQVGSDDAETLSLQFEELATPNDILSLPKYHAYARLMVDGMASKPFSVGTLPPPEFTQDAGRLETLIALSRERYAEKRSVVEEKINRYAASAAQGKTQAKEVEKAKEKEEEERKKAKKKGMTLDEYRKWRDREMWLNDFNMLRKRNLLDQDLSDTEKVEMQKLQKKLEESGGVPEVSKTLLAEIEKRK